jgi:hypothetical protein
LVQARAGGVLQNRKDLLWSACHQGIVVDQEVMRSVKEIPLTCQMEIGQNAA